MKKLYCEKCGSVLPKWDFLCEKCGHSNGQLIYKLEAEYDKRRIIKNIIKTVIWIGVVVGVCFLIVRTAALVAGHDDAAISKIEERKRAESIVIMLGETSPKQCVSL